MSVRGEILALPSVQCVQSHAKLRRGCDKTSKMFASQASLAHAKRKAHHPALHHCETTGLGYRQEDLMGTRVPLVFAEGNEFVLKMEAHVRMVFVYVP